MNILDSEIKIVAIEYHEYKNPNLVVLAEHQGKRFYVNIHILEEMMNDVDFNVIGYIRHMAKNVLESLLLEKVKGE